MSPTEIHAQQDGESQSLGHMLLSHHAPHEYDRCVRLGSVHLCARCLGIYPALVAGLVLFAHLPPFPPWLEWTLLLGLPAPALLDWGRSWVWQVPGRNSVRLLTGALLGLAVARNLHLQWAEPFEPRVLIQAAAIGGAAALIWIIGFSRRQHVDTGDFLR